MEVSSVHLGKICCICMLLFAFLSISSVRTEDTDETTDSSKKSTTISANNATDEENTKNSTNTILGTWNKITENKEMLQRAFYVLLGVTGIVVVYFIVRAIRVRHRRNRTRRYGLLSGRGDKLELAPLDNPDDDDEEDVTVYEMNGKRLR